MGRLPPFLQLAVAACFVAFFGIWGSLPAELAAAPLLVVVLCPLLSASAVWPLGTMGRALAVSLITPLYGIILGIVCRILKARVEQ